MTRHRNTQPDETELSEADEISILIATDNHVGYAERDQIRGDDSWRTFHEIMEIAKARDVDMVLLAGDLFHDNKPSRKSMFNVMRSLRLNCFGDRPCSLQLLSDASENFGGTFDHVNYEDEDINVSIPVFSIHGNHDDPTEEGRYAALDLLQVSGLVNYFGKTPESDNIVIKPVLLQKGRTKLALYGMSNVRDERLFRTFRDGKVRFFQPDMQKKDWFNLMAVHQNHHAHTQTGYLPENFLPEFMDFIVWGHEHACEITPRLNPEMQFYVSQPGSSIATSLASGEAQSKKVAIMKLKGRSWDMEYIRLKTVRPFVMREIVLAEERALKNIWKKSNNRPELTRHLEGVVHEMIAEANQQYVEIQEDDADTDSLEIPKPLIRLRIEFTAPDNGLFDLENAQRFSNRFAGQVANVTDVVQYYRKKVVTRKEKVEVALPEQAALAELSLDTIKVEKLVREFLAAQTLSILPQNSFGEAVGQFVDKDDRNAMDDFVKTTLTKQWTHLVKTGGDDDAIEEAMDQHKSTLEELFAAGYMKKRTKRKLKPKPETWDSEMDGHWSDQPEAFYRAEIPEGEDNDEDDDAASVSTSRGAARGRGRGRGRAAGRAAAATSTRKTAAASKKPAATSKSTRGRKQVVEEEEDDDEESDVQMVLDDDDESESESMFVRTKKPTAARSSARTAKATPAPSQATRQSKLVFSQPSRTANGSRTGAGRRAAQQSIVISDDEISDDDAFEPAPTASRRR